MMLRDQQSRRRASTRAFAVIAMTSLLDCRSHEPGPDPEEKHPLTGALSVAVGYGYACAILASKEVTCWGERFPPYGSKSTPSTARAASVPGLSGVIQLALGHSHAC